MNRERVQELSTHFESSQDPTGWFEALYAEAGDDPSHVPWADQEPHPLLVEWLDARSDHRGEALVVACGLGDDAEELARRGYRVTAFDLSPSAIRWAQRRFPESSVDYRFADLLQLPPGWSRRFDLVFESNTVQAMPRSQANAAVRAIADCVRPGGQLLVLCRAREETVPLGGPPRPLSRTDLEDYPRAGLREVCFEHASLGEEPPVPRSRVLYRRPD